MKSNQKTQFRVSPTSLLLCASALLGGARARAAEPTPPAQAPSLELYLLIGQSNMAGRGRVEIVDQTPHPRVLVFDKNEQWKAATEPLHFDKPKMAGVGPGLAFGKAMAQAHPENTIGLIPCAVGGSSLGRWEKGGALYQEAVRRTRLAMKTGRLQGILWHQGEADAGQQTSAESYAKRLAVLVADLCADLEAPDAPFVAGQTGEFLYASTKNPVAYARTVNEQLATLPTLVPCAGFVSSHELKDRGDELHFDAPGARELGHRYAVEMLRLQDALAAKKP